MKNNEKNILLYVQLGPKIRKHYYQLYQYLFLEGFKVICLSPNELSQYLRHNGTTNVLLVESSMEEREHLIKDAKLKLEMYLRQNRIKLFHCTSFYSSELEVHYKHRAFYTLLPLPLNIIDIVRYLKITTTEIKPKEDNTWPGKSMGTISFLKNNNP